MSVVGPPVAATRWLCRRYTAAAQLPRCQLSGARSLPQPRCLGTSILPYRWADDEQYLFEGYDSDSCDGYSDVVRGSANNGHATGSLRRVLYCSMQALQSCSCCADLRACPPLQDDSEDEGSWVRCSLPG